MSDRAKRILLILGFLLIVIVIGFGIWWFFFRPIFRPPALPPVPPLAPPPTVGLPPAAPAPPLIPITPSAAPPEAAPTAIASGGLTQTTGLTNAPILSPTLAPDGTSLQYYNRTDGRFYRIRPDGTTELLSDKVFFNVSQLTWAPDRNQAILEYPDGSNILYDFSTRRQVSLPRHWQNFSFSPRSDGIAFLSIGIDEDTRWLGIAAPDGSSAKPIEPLGDNASKVQVAWSPNDQVIAFSRTGLPQGLDAQEVLLVGKQGENFRSLLVNGIGFRGRWSPDGQILLYSATSGAGDFKPQIWLVEATPDRIGANKTPVALNTWADKCTFASTTVVYCAVPVELPRGAGLYPAVAGNTPDQLWRVDLVTGGRERTAIPEGSHTIDNLVASSDGRYLYFTNRLSGQLYKINLK